MKKTILNLAMAVSLLCGTLIPAQSHAFMILDTIWCGMIDQDPIWKQSMQYGPETTGAIACIVLLPLCLLAEDDAPYKVSAQELQDAGYSDLQIANIEQGQALFRQSLVTKQVNVNNSTLQNPKAMQSVLESIPGMNRDYIDFVVNN